MPLNIADLQGDPAVGHLEGVVPVSADVQPVPARPVAGGDLQAREMLGQPGEHGLLQRRGQLDSCLLQPDAPQCLARQVGQRTHEDPLVQGRPVSAGVGHQPRPERLIACLAEGVIEVA